MASHRSAPMPAIFALVDFDPDGISIMSTYKLGSYQLSHESENLKVPAIQWLGIKSRDLVHNIDGTTNEDDRGLLKLSVRDRKKAVSMLENNKALVEKGAEQEWRRELQLMLMLGVKAEMEILGKRDGGVEAWVRYELEQRVQTSFVGGTDPLTNHLEGEDLEGPSDGVVDDSSTPDRGEAGIARNR